MRKPAHKPGIKTNATWNCAGVVGDAVLAVLIMPFTIHTLGDTTYGLWVLIGSLTGCFGVLDLGVRGALGRQLAFHRARRDSDNVNATLNTGLALLSGACIVTLLGVVLLQFLFFSMFDVPSDQVAAVRVALWIAGLRLALSFPMSAFDATLWAAERFDRLNQIDLATRALSVAMIYALLTPENGLLLLPLIGLGGLLLATALKAANTWIAWRWLSFGPRFLSRAALRSIFGFGLWNSAGAIARQAGSRVPALVIGAFVSPAAVTPFAVADRILAMFRGFFAAFSGVLTPRSAAYAATEDRTGQLRLFIYGGRICASLAIFAAAGACLFGRDVILVWLGPAQSIAAVYLAILAIGMVPTFSQSITRSILLGIARHRIMNSITMVEAAVAAIGALFAAYCFGPLAVCFTMSATWGLAGIAQMLNGCAAVGVPVGRYVRRAVIPAFAVCALPGIAWLCLPLAAATGMLVLVTYIIAFSLLFAVPFIWVSVRPVLALSGVRLPKRDVGPRVGETVANPRERVEAALASSKGRTV